MTSPTSSGDDMLKKVRAKVLDGKIELLEDLNLEEGEEITILIEVKQEAQSLFGLLAGSATIKGDIISPVDIGWDVLQ